MLESLRALCNLAQQCNVLARQFAVCYSECEAAPIESEIFPPDIWGPGNRAREDLLHAQHLLDELKEEVSACHDPDWIDEWWCIEQAVLDDPPQRYVVGDESHGLAHKAAFAQAKAILSLAGKAGMNSSVDELGLEHSLKTMERTSNALGLIVIDDLFDPIRREFLKAVRYSEPESTDVESDPSSNPAPDGENGKEKQKRKSAVPIPKNPRVSDLAQALKKQMEKPRDEWGSQNEVAKNFVTEDGLFPFTGESDSASTASRLASQFTERSHMIDNLIDHLGAEVKIETGLADGLAALRAEVEVLAVVFVGEVFDAGEGGD